jgi:DNA end-binding protein Ku
VAEEHEEDDVGPRSFWSGTITFGLVSIPVELFPANRSQRVSLRMVAPDGTPLARRYFCPQEDRELDWDEIVRGYEIEKDTYVVVTDDELDRLAPEKTRDIDLRVFVAADEIDPMHFERAYYLTPGGNSTKAYRLLAATMEQTGRAGIATFVMRGKEYLVAILAENGIMRAETLRFADEVRTPEDIGLPSAQQPKAALVKRMEKAVMALAEKELDEAELTDAGAERLRELAARKEKRGTDVVPAPAGERAEPGEGVIDLMEVLKRSLQGGGAGAAKKSTAAATKGSRSRAAKRAGGTKSKAAARRSGAKWSKSHLAKQAKEELYEKAKELDIEGRSSMTKDQLIEAIRGA